MNMSGVPRDHLIGGDFVLLRMALVDDLGGNYEAAIVFQRVAWRCERTGEWEADLADIQAETRLSEWKVKQAVKVLRDRGWLKSHRADPHRSTLTWSVVVDDGRPGPRPGPPAPNEGDESPSRDGGILRPGTAGSSVTETEDSSVPSLEDVETNYFPLAPAAVAAGERPPAPAAVAAGEGCPKHRVKPHGNCRGCGTSPRASRPEPSGPPPKARRPRWCGACDERTRLVEDEHGDPRHCYVCHPAEVAPWDVVA